MNDDSFAFLKSIEETPSVSGYEGAVAKRIRERMKPIADSIEGRPRLFKPVRDVQ